MGQSHVVMRHSHIEMWHSHPFFHDFATLSIVYALFKYDYATQKMTVTHFWGLSHSDIWQSHYSYVFVHTLFADLATFYFDFVSK